jgi:hypothetical protein
VLNTLLINMHIFYEAWPHEHSTRRLVVPSLDQIHAVFAKNHFEPYFRTRNYAHTEEFRQPNTFCTISDPKAYLCQVSGGSRDPPRYRVYNANIAASLFWSRMYITVRNRLSEEMLNEDFFAIWFWRGPHAMVCVFGVYFCYG